MPKPVCPKCRMFYRPKRNGTYVLEGKPRGSLVPPGREAEEHWLPYKLWMGDLWECRGCGAEVVVGFGQTPVSQDFKEDFADVIRSAESTGRFAKCNDC